MERTAAQKRQVETAQLQSRRSQPLWPDRVEKMKGGDIRHAHLSVGEREHLSGTGQEENGKERMSIKLGVGLSHKEENLANALGERNGSLSDGVKGSEEEDEEGDAADLCSTCTLRNQETQARPEQAPCHSVREGKRGRRGDQLQVLGQGAQEMEQKLIHSLREGDKDKRSSSKGVDGDESREGEEEVDGSEAERGVERVSGRVAREDEDRRRVESYDVDSAHLLGEHWKPRMVSFVPC
jgi:hypothetical protein